MKYKDKKLKKAVEELRRLSADEEVVRQYEIEDKIERDRISEREYLIKEATEEGMTKGLQKGIEQTTKNSALNFYKNGVSKEIICQSLNISLEELNNIF